MNIRPDVALEVDIVALLEDFEIITEEDMALEDIVHREEIIVLDVALHHQEEMIVDRLLLEEEMTVPEETARLEGIADLHHRRNREIAVAHDAKARAL